MKKLIVYLVAAAIGFGNPFLGGCSSTKPDLESALQSCWADTDKAYSAFLTQFCYNAGIKMDVYDEISPSESDLLNESIKTDYDVGLDLLARGGFEGGKRNRLLKVVYDLGLYVFDFETATFDSTGN